MGKTTVWMLSAYDQPGGNSPRTAQFAEYLASCNNNVVFFTNNYCHFKKRNTSTPRGLWHRQKLKNYTVVWLNTLPYKSNTGVGRVLNMVDNFLRICLAATAIDERPDIIIGPSVPITTGLAGCLIACVMRVPFVYEIRDLWPDSLVDLQALRHGSISYKILKAFEKYLYRHADAIVSSLPFVHKHIDLNKGSSEKVTYIPNGANFKTCNLPARAKSATKDKQNFTVMYFGGYGLGHDVNVLIRAAQLLQKDQEAKYRFILYGDGPKRKQLEQTVLKEKISNVQFKEVVPKQQIPVLAQQANLLVAAITDSPVYRHGVNLNKLVSYFMTGRPIVFAGNSANISVMEANAGMCVSAGNEKELAKAIMTLSKCDHEVLEQLGINGYNYAKDHLDLDVLGQKYANVIKSCIENYKTYGKSKS